jgi:hypothetical protein
MTVQEAYPLFMAHGRAERQYAKETLGKLKDCFQSWILPRLGDRPVEDMTRLHVLAFRGGMTNAKLGANRQYSVLMVLKLFLKFCHQVLRLDCLGPKEIHLPQRPKPHVQDLQQRDRTKSFKPFSVDWKKGF